MCAINGITKNDTDLVTHMNEVTKHRGPDGTGIWSGNNITLGHNRLAIIDLSSAAAQPMLSNNERYVLVFNGEIYNYIELRDELKNSYEFKTNSDSEVLLAAFSVWGENMLSKLRGVFSFAIWDTEKEELLLVRDHMGVKPLYYSFRNKVLTFSSELQGIVNTNKKINHEAVSLFLELQYVPSDLSFVENVHKLSPGCLLRYKRGEIKVETYFDHLHKENIAPTETLYKTIDTAVGRQLISDRPVGVFLSGGFDSSIVLHHASKYHKNPKTYSIGFDVTGINSSEAEKYNADSVLAEKTAGFYNAKHSTFFLKDSDVANELENIYQSIDEPVSTSTSVSQYFLNRFVRDDGTVVALGGDGGDELFGGYTRHRAMMAAFWFQKLPDVIQKTIGHIHPRGKKLQTPFFTDLHLELMATNEENIKSTLKNNIGSMEITKNFFDKKYTNIPQQMHELEVYMRVDRQTWLADHSLTRSDRTSMIHGVEFRVPLLDLDVVEYADNMSSFKKSSPFVGKKIIRNTYKKHLPQHLFSEPKRGWLSPGAKWLRSPLVNKVVRDVLSPEYYDGLNELFDWNKVQNSLDKHCNGEQYLFHPLWSILILQIWSRKHNLIW